jgi:Flp pilus assembly protein TadD
LSSDYSYDAVPVVRSPADPRLLAGVALLVVLVWVAVRAYRTRSALPGVAVAVWVLFLLPSSNLLFPAGTLMAERLTYLPSLAACLLAGHGLAAWAARSEGVPDRKRRIVPVLAVAVGLAALLAWRTVQRNPDWKDNRTLAAADVRIQPRSAKLHAGLAIAAHRDGDLGVAERHYREALRIWAGYAQVHHNLGVLLERTGRDPEALASYREAARLAPGNPRPWKALAPLLWSSGAREEALSAYASGTLANPADAAFRYRYGRALLLSGRAGEGTGVLRELAADYPDGWPGLLASAVVRRLEGDHAGSEAILERLRERADLPADVRELVERNAARGDR